MDPVTVILVMVGCGIFLSGCAKQKQQNEAATTSGWEMQPEEEIVKKVINELDEQENMGEPVVRGAEVICSNGKDSEDVLLLLGDEDSTVEMAGLIKMAKSDILLSNNNKFKYCKFFDSVCPGLKAEEDIWQLYNPKDDMGEEKNELDYNLSFIFCTNGWGIIHFKNSGQEMANFIENSYTCQFVGYLAYGAGGIVKESDSGFFKLYNAPTLGSKQEKIYFKDLYDQYGVEPNGALQSFGGSVGVNKEGSIKYGGQEKDPMKGTLIYNGLGRYAIALAPKLQNPNCDLTKKIEPDDMAYGTCVDISIDLEGETYYIPAIIVDIKGHSAPDGIFQTGVPFEGAFVDTGKTGPIVEWYIEQVMDDKNKSAGLKQFDDTGSLVFYRDEVLK